MPSPAASAARAGARAPRRRSPCSGHPSPRASCAPGRRSAAPGPAPGPRTPFHGSRAPGARWSRARARGSDRTATSRGPGAPCGPRAADPRGSRARRPSVGALRAPDGRRRRSRAGRARRGPGARSRRRRRARRRPEDAPRAATLGARVPRGAVGGAITRSKAPLSRRRSASAGREHIPDGQLARGEELRPRWPASRRARRPCGRCAPPRGSSARRTGAA